MAWLQSRAWVGPKWEKSNSAYFYDWAASHESGAEMPAIAGAVLTLPSTINATVTTFNVTRPADLAVPEPGGIWVSGNAAGQGWEYIQYTDIAVVNSTTVTISGAIREPAANREHNGSHNSGATVRFFWPLDSMAGEFSFVEEMDDNECVIDWTGEASGWKFPQAALRDGHLFIYQTRTDAADPFRNRLIGFIDARNSEHDYKRAGKWVVKIVSSSGMINRYRAYGVRRGAFNLARGASVSASSALGAAWKERASGDYVAAEPSFDGSSAVDDELTTLWIADSYIGTENARYIYHADPDEGTVISDPTIETNGARLKGGTILITEIHLAESVGQPPGYRYIELTSFGDQGWASRNVRIATEDIDENFSLSENVGTWLDGQKIILCENEEKFRQENPSANPTTIIDLGAFGFAYILRNRSLANGAFGIWMANSVEQIYYHYVAWGSGQEVVINSAFTGTIAPFYSGLFPGTDLAASSNGETYRYNYANSATAASNWTLSLLHAPGYAINGGFAHMLIELPPMGLMLAEDITDSYTGAVRLTDGTMETTAGLAATGSIQIGGEIITYSARGATTITLSARGASSTTAAAHVIDDAVFVSESGIALNAMPIRRVEIVRTGSIIPEDVNIRAARLHFPPRLPGEPNYDDDYEFSAAITGNIASTLIYNFATTRRIRFLLLEFIAMSTNPARPRVNEVRVIPDEAYFDSSTWLSGGETGGELVEQLLGNIGFPIATGLTLGSTSGSGEHATANRMAWDVIREYAAYAGLMLEVGRNSKIVVSTNSYLTSEFFTTDFTWTRSDAVNIKALHAPPKAVAQVKLKWQDNDITAKGTVVFPAEPDATGEVLEMDEQVYEDEAQAQVRAERVYYRNKFPYSWIAESAEGGGEFRPSEIHILSDWKLNSEMQPINRLCLVRSVDHLIQQSPNTHTLNWRNVVNLVEIQRTQAA